MPKVRGEAHYRARLTDAKAREIVALIAAGVTRQEVATLFNVSKTTVDRVTHGQSWAAVTAGQEDLTMIKHIRKRKKAKRAKKLKEPTMTLTLHLSKGLGRRLKAAAEGRREPKAQIVRELMEGGLPPLPPIDFEKELAPATPVKRGPGRPRKIVDRPPVGSGVVFEAPAPAPASIVDRKVDADTVEPSTFEAQTTEMGQFNPATGSYEEE